MSTLLVKNAKILATMDVQDTEIPEGGLFIRDGFIEQVGSTQSLPKQAPFHLTTPRNMWDIGLYIVCRPIGLFDVYIWAYSVQLKFF